MDYFHAGIVDRYGGDHRVRTLSCAEQYRSMAFAQLRPTGKACATSRPASRSTHRNSITWASASRSGARRWPMPTKGASWRIHAALAQRLITQARTLYVDEELGLDLTNTVYALDSTTSSVPVGLSVGALPHHQGGGEDAHAARPAGTTFRVLSTSRMASCTTFMPSICSCRKPEPSTSWIVATSTLPAFMCCTKPGPSSNTRAGEHRCSSRLFGADGSLDRQFICDRPSPWTASTPVRITPLLRRIRFKDPESGKTLVFITNNFSLPAATICALYKSRWQVELFFKWIKQHLRIKQFYGTSENAVKTQIWIAVSVYVLVAIVKKRLDLDASLYTLITDPLGDPLRENAHTSSTCGRPDATLRK